MKKKWFTVKGKVELFPQKGGWTYVRVPQTYADLGIAKPKWGLVPIVASIGSTEWNTSLLPMGDGTLFIALKKPVRKKEQIQKRDTITLIFTLA